MIFHGIRTIIALKKRYIFVIFQGAMSPPLWIRACPWTNILLYRYNSKLVWDCVCSHGRFVVYVTLVLGIVVISFNFYLVYDILYIHCTMIMISGDTVSVLLFNEYKNEQYIVINMYLRPANSHVCLASVCCFPIWSAVTMTILI